MENNTATLTPAHHQPARDTEAREQNDGWAKSSPPSVTKIVAIVVVVVALAAAVVMASEIFLTLVLAILFGIFLHRVAHLIAQTTPLSRDWAIGLIVFLLLASSLAATSLFYVQVDRQIEKASQQMGAGLQEIQSLMKRSPSVRSVVKSLPFVSDAIPPAQQAAKNAEKSSESAPSSQPTAAERNATEQLPALSTLKTPLKQAADTLSKIFKTTFGLVMNSVLIFFVGLFLAVSPATYREGLVKLVVPDKRDRARDVLQDVVETLWKWLLGRFASMLVTGIGAAIILWLIGVPMAGTLGIITGLLTFIPNIGAAIALSLSILFALPQGAMTAALVVPAYLGLQLVESYLVTPLIQKRQVAIPPALLISVQAIMGVLFGILGAAVASPLLAGSKVAIEKIYIADVLEADRVN